MKKKRLQGVGAPGAADTDVDCHRRSEGAEICAHAQADRPSISAALEIARLVAAPARPVVLIDAQNRSPRRCGLDELPEALRDPRVTTFAVVPRADLVAIDADSSAQVSSAIDFAAWCRGELFDVVVCNSGGATDDGLDRLHVWVRVPRAHDRNRVRGKARSLGLPIRDMSSAGTSGAIRPPGAPHRAGDGLSQPIDVTLSDFGLMLSGRPYGRREPRPIPTPPPPPEIAPQANPERVEGTFEAGRRRDATRSADVFVAFVRAHRRGLDLERALYELDGRSAEKVTEKGARWARHQWAAAGRLVDKSSAVESRDHALRLIWGVREQASRAGFKGLAGGSARRILDVILDLAEAQGSVHVAVSTRGLAQRTGFSLPTVRAGLRRLRGLDARTGERTPDARRWIGIKSGYLRNAIQLADGTSAPRPTVYRVEPPVAEPLTVSASGNLLPMDSGHVAFAWRGLGPTGLFVLRALDRQQGCTLAEIAARSGVGRRTVSTKLRLLERYGLVEQRNLAWFPVEAEVVSKLDRVAKRHQLDVRALRMAQAFEEQRRAFYRRGENQAQRLPERVVLVQGPRPPPDRAAA